AIKYTYDRVRDNTVYNEKVKDIGWYTSGEVLSIMDNHNKQVSNEKKSMMMRYTHLSRMGYCILQQQQQPNATTRYSSSSSSIIWEDVDDDDEVVYSWCLKRKLEVRLDNVVQLMMDDITMVMENSRNTTADGGETASSPSKEYVDRATSPIISSSSQYDAPLGSSTSDVPDVSRIRNTTVALLFEASASAAASPTVDGPTPVGGGGYDDGKEAVMRVDRILRGWLSETLPLKEVVVESLLAAAAPN
ncbi:hypothetical protein FOZ63_007682, partial [Perkinsus olseni]